MAAAFSTRPFNVIANIASILGLLVALGAELAWDTDFIPVLYVCGLSLFFLVRYVRQERWARYAEGSQVMNRAHRRLKEASDRLLFGNSDREVFFLGLQESLSAFAEAFTLVTGTDCRASLKEVYTEEMLPAAGKKGGQAEPKKVLLVATIARSNIDESRLVSQEPSDLLDENSDFQEVFSSAKPFHADDLPTMWRAGKYRNSHWGEDLRSTNKFPYKSTVIWPIEVDPPLGSETSLDEDRVIAFLCVDSRRRSAFGRRADVAFGSMFAHALYPGLRYALAPGGDR